MYLWDGSQFGLHFNETNSIIRISYCVLRKKRNTQAVGFFLQLQVSNKLS